MESRSGFNLNKLMAWWDNVERGVYRLLMFFFILLIVTQGLLTSQTVKSILSSTEKLEGKSVSDTRPTIKKGSIELTIMGSSHNGDIDIYINGEKAASFYNNKVALNVRNSDIIEISGVRSENTAMIQVTDSSEGVTTPELGRTLTINGNLVYLCRVKLK